MQREPNSALIDTAAAPAAVRWARPPIIAALLLAAVFAVALWPVISGARIAIGDAHRYFIPRYMVLDDFARAGQFLLWNPYTNCGEPDWIEPQCGVTSPVLLLASFLMHGSVHTYAAVWLGTWFLGGLGMMVLGRRLGAPLWIAAGIALLYLFNGFYISNAPFASWVYNIAAAPWFIWLLDRGLERRRCLWFAGAGLIWGLAGNGGHPAVAGLLALLAGAWVVMRLLSRRRSSLAEPAGVPKRGLLLGLLLCAAVGLLVVCPPYVGLQLEGPGYSGRASELTRDYVLNYDSWDPSSAVTVLSPGLGWAFDHAWPKMNAVSLYSYLAPAILVLAAYALTRRGQLLGRWFLAIVGAIGLVLAAGRFTPVMGWLLDALPLLKFNRHLGVYKFVPVFIVTVLAMMGAADLSQLVASGKRSRRLQWVTLLLAIVAIVSFYWTLHTKATLPGDLPGSVRTVSCVGLGATWAIVLALSECVGLLSPRKLAIGFVLLCVTDTGFNVWLSQGLFLMEPTSEYRYALAHRPTDLDLTSQQLQRVAQMPECRPRQSWSVVTKQATANDYTPLLNTRSPRASSELFLMPVVCGAQRLWFSAQPVVAPPNDETYKQFRQRVLLGDPPVVLHEAAEMVRPKADAAASAAVGSAPSAIRLGGDVTSYTPRQLSLRVSAPADGWLVVTDRWCRGWEATVNGQAQEIMGAMLYFRAVQVKAGLNEIVFNYRPRAFYPLLVISWGTTGAVLAWLAIAATRRLRRGERPTNA